MNIFQISIFWYRELIRRLSKYHVNKKPYDYGNEITRNKKPIKIKHKISGHPIFIKKDDSIIENYLHNNVLWCKRNLGYTQNIKNTPRIYWSYYDLDIESVGYSTFGYYSFDKNTIHIKITGHRTWVQLSNTVIHEWVHYLQSHIWYSRYSNMYEYEENPYEIEACNYANIFCTPCAEYSLNKIHRIKKK